MKKYSYKHDIFYWWESASQDFANLTDTHEKSAADLWMIYWFWKPKWSQWYSAFLGEAVASLIKNITLSSIPPRNWPQHK